MSAAARGDVEAAVAAAVTGRPARAARPKADPACVAAVDTARAALVEEVGADVVGPHLGYEVEGERVVTHSFGCLLAGYVGWRWAVVVARASRARLVTVDEVVLLPGPAAVLAPPWLPWAERVQPGDLGPGDVLPAGPDDPRLVPGWTGADTLPADAEPDLVTDLGLGRARVLSVEGREDAAERWYDGPAGPRTDVAKAAPAPCASCGFLVALAGPLGAAFGVCANAMSPDDGHVVSFDHGCGAHSEAAALARAAASAAPVHDTVLDEVVLHGSVSTEDAAEDLGHS